MGWWQRWPRTPDLGTGRASIPDWRWWSLGLSCSRSQPGGLLNDLAPEWLRSDRSSPIRLLRLFQPVPATPPDQSGFPRPARCTARAARVLAVAGRCGICPFWQRHRYCWLPNSVGGSIHRSHFRTHGVLAGMSEVRTRVGRRGKDTSRARSRQRPKFKMTHYRMGSRVGGSPFLT